jgi:hypothetical protein
MSDRRALMIEGLHYVGIAVRDLDRSLNRQLLVGNNGARAQ